VADEPLRIAEAPHDLVAAVDAGAAADAFVLQAVADVDAGGAYLHADVAADAITEGQLLALRRPGARAARFAALAVVGNDQRIRVEHDALEARVRAHVLAYLLAHESGVAVGGKGIEENPERFPRAELAAQGAHAQVANGREVGDEGVAGPQRDDEPGAVLGRLDDEFFERERRAVETDSRQAIAFDLALDPGEDFRVHRLRTGVAAPQPAGDRGEEEERQGAQDQQHAQVDDVLRPEDEAEDVELARGKIEQDRLAPVPGKPWQPVIDRLGQKHQPPAPAGEP